MRRRLTLFLLISAWITAIAQTVRASYTYNPNDFATAVVNSTVSNTGAAYSDPTALLGQPPLTFNNSTNPNVQISERVKIVEPPFNVDLNGNQILTRLPNSSGTTQVTVQMGSPITHNPAHPYGDDLIVFGNSYYLGNGTVTDSTNLNSYTVTGQIYSHPVQVWVSPDDVNWFSFPVTTGLQPYNAYQWSDANAAWTTNELNPTVPLNPSVYTTNFAGDTAAQILDAYGTSAGGTAFDLDNAVDANGNTLFQDGFNSIDYVQVASTASGYAIVSGISAVSAQVPQATVYIIPEPSGLGLLIFAAASLLRHRRP